MEIINISPMKIKFPYANSELGLRPEPTPADPDWKVTEDLLNDIRSNGMSDLFSVRPLGNDEYEVINGSRRAKVCQILCEEAHPDYQQIPVQISNIDEITSLERQIAGNANVKATNAKQYSAALVKIAVNKQYDVSALAKAVGKSESFVNNMLRFNRLPETIQDLVATYKMPVTNAIAMTKLPKDLDLNELVEDACVLDTNAFGLRVKEAVDAYAAEKKALKGGQEPKFELTEKRISNDQIKANLEKAKNLVEEDSSEFNHGYLFAYEEIFQVDEKAAVERKAKWDADQEAKKVAKEARKADTEAKKRKELADYAKKNNITDLSQLTA
jgi:ParB/RepB/Spo0J family partition protein